MATICPPPDKHYLPPWKYNWWCFYAFSRIAIPSIELSSPKHSMPIIFHVYILVSCDTVHGGEIMESSPWMFGVR